MEYTKKKRSARPMVIAGLADGSHLLHGCIYLPLLGDGRASVASGFEVWQMTFSELSFESKLYIASLASQLCDIDSPDDLTGCRRLGCAVGSECPMLQRAIDLSGMISLLGPTALIKCTIEPVTNVQRDWVKVQEELFNRIKYA